MDNLAHLARRHALEIHALRAPPDDARAYEYQGLTVFAYGRKTKLERAAAFIRRTMSRAPTVRFDVVWSLWPDKTGMLAAVAAALIRRPLVLSLMGGEIASIPSLSYGSYAEPRRRFEVRRALGLARRITVGSRVLWNRLFDVAPRVMERVRIAPLGVRPERISLVREESWTGDRVLRLAAVMDASPIKRPEALERVLVALEARGVKAKIDVFGDWPGSLFPRIEKMGFVAADALGAKLAGYDALIHPSAHESQGMALIESAMAGLPVACTAVGVAEELHELGAAVSIARDPEPAALADATIDAARQRVPPEALLRIHARFGLEACSARFERVLEEAAA